MPQKGALEKQLTDSETIISYWQEDNPGPSISFSNLWISSKSTCSDVHLGHFWESEALPHLSVLLTSAQNNPFCCCFLHEYPFGIFSKHNGTICLLCKLDSGTFLLINGSICLHDVSLSHWTEGVSIFKCQPWLTTVEKISTTTAHTTSAVNITSITTKN